MSEQLQHGMNCPALTPSESDDCRCGLKYRIEAQTNLTLLTAWQKRCAEAEVELAESERKLGAAEGDRSLLANAIQSAAVRAGICNDGISLTGPHLLMLCNDITVALEAAEQRIRESQEQEPWVSVTSLGDLPEVGEWVNVLQDKSAFTEGDYLPSGEPNYWFPQEFYYAKNNGKWIKRVACAQLKYIDREGWAYWEQGSLSSGRSLVDVWWVSHFKRLPPIPNAEKE